MKQDPELSNFDYLVIAIGAMALIWDIYHIYWNQA